MMDLLERIKQTEKSRLNARMLLLSLVIVVIDQIVKAIVVAKIPMWTGSVSVIGDFLTFIHVRNLGMGFSIGAELSGFLRVLVVIVVPLLITILLAFATIYGEALNWADRFQSWSLAVIVGGSTGTLIDRIFRPSGVVDFISVKLYGFLGMQYWPTFNLSDSAVVVGAFMLLINSLVESANESKKSKQNSQSDR